MAQKWQQADTNTKEYAPTNEIRNGTTSLSGRLISCPPWAHPKDALFWYTSWQSLSPCRYGKWAKDDVCQAFVVSSCRRQDNTQTLPVGHHSVGS